MNLVIKQSVETPVLVDFECYEGSHLFLKSSSTELYRDWEDLSEDERRLALKLKTTVKTMLRSFQHQAEGLLKA